MNEYDDLFNREDKKPAASRHNEIEEFHEYINKQRGNGLLIAIYILISLLFSFGQQLIKSNQFPDPDAILNNIVLISDIQIDVSDSENEDFPYTYVFSGTLRNNNSIDIPTMYVRIDFYSGDESLGSYTITSEDFIAGSLIEINESEDFTENFDRYEVFLSFDESASFYTLMNLLPVMIVGILFIFIDRKSFKYDAVVMKQNPKKYFGQIFSGIVMVYAVLILANMILDLLGVVGTSENEMAIQGLFSSDPVQIVMLFLLLCVFTPIVEEVVFRKVLYNFLQPRTSDIVAILLSGAIFGLMHVIAYQDFIQSIPYIFMGLVFGYIYYRANKNIYVTIGVHFLNNFISFSVYVLMIYGIYL